MGLHINLLNNLVDWRSAGLDVGSDWMSSHNWSNEGLICGFDSLPCDNCVGFVCA